AAAPGDADRARPGRGDRRRRRRAVAYTGGLIRPRRARGGRRRGPGRGRLWGLLPAPEAPDDPGPGAPPENLGERAKRKRSAPAPAPALGSPAAAWSPSVACSWWPWPPAEPSTGSVGPAPFVPGRPRSAAG